mmetsp:Transcript_49200/g.125338  ORF Transcript_49200/g.125338 Transcript_49200/m.125338 type:complete len:371 (-) Transcript_49200:1039-2151(-)
MRDHCHFAEWTLLPQCHNLEAGCIQHRAIQEPTHAWLDDSTGLACNPLSADQPTDWHPYTLFGQACPLWKGTIDVVDNCGHAVDQQAAQHNGQSIQANPCTDEVADPHAPGSEDDRVWRRRGREHEGKGASCCGWKQQGQRVRKRLGRDCGEDREDDVRCRGVGCDLGEQADTPHDEQRQQKPAPTSELRQLIPHTLREPGLLEALRNREAAAHENEDAPRQALLRYFPSEHGLAWSLDRWDEKEQQSGSTSYGGVVDALHISDLRSIDEILSHKEAGKLQELDDRHEDLVAVQRSESLVRFRDHALVEFKLDAADKEKVDGCVGQQHEHEAQRSSELEPIRRTDGRCDHGQPREHAIGRSADQRGDAAT